ncbi:MAG TPA: cytochrome c peroxidase, partial [Rubellimicrobium sp.]|nr:cytochrome c peroxidase [Rubellimicrobium sp.]
MNDTPYQVATTINSMPHDRGARAKAFLGEDDPVSFDNFANAIAAFEATLVTPGAPFDRWLEGDDPALTDVKKQGVQPIMDGGCPACHGGGNFGGQDDYAFGLLERPGGDMLPEGDLGRFAVTDTPGDDCVFRTALLRNVALTAPYFHLGAVWSPPEAVHITGAAQLGANLTVEEVDAIMALLPSLTGAQPAVVHKVLPPGLATRRTPISSDGIRRDR